jgi:hypothetical protein
MIRDGHALSDYRARLARNSASSSA